MQRRRSQWRRPTTWHVREGDRWIVQTGRSRYVVPASQQDARTDRRPLPPAREGELTGQARPAPSISRCSAGPRNVSRGPMLDIRALQRNKMRNYNPDRGLGTGVIAGIGAVALIAAVIIWAPWNGSYIAESSAPSTTVGSSTTRPGAPSTTR